MLFVSDEQREFLDLDGAPLPFIDDKRGRCYMLMPVNFTRSPGSGVYARVPGIRAVGEAERGAMAAIKGSKDDRVMALALATIGAQQT